MPFEPIYGLPIEAPSDLPGWSLTGGPDGDQPILAERVAAQLRRLDDLVQQLTDSFGTYPALIQAGAVSVTPSVSVPNTFYNAAYFRGSASVVFATPFTVNTPSVVVCTDSTIPGTLIEASASNVTLTGFNANTARTNTTASMVFWIASARTQF